MKFVSSVLCLSSLLLSAAPGVSRAGEPEIDRAIQRVFAAIDEDRDGSIPMPDVLKAVGIDPSKGVPPRAMRMLALYDGNKDGRLEREEFHRGHEALVEQQLERALGTDTDGDGQLNAKEFALGVPDPEGQKLKSGLTKMQTERFRASDLDGNGLVDREELVKPMSQGLVDVYTATALTKRLSALDEDSDGSLSSKELAVIYGDEPKAAEEAKAAWKKLSEDEAPIKLQALQGALRRLGEEGQRKAELRLSLHELGLRLRVSLDRLFRVADTDKDKLIQLDEFAAMEGVEKLEESMLRILVTFDANKDRNLSFPELEQGLPAFVRKRSVDRAMALDVNANGRLTPREYALGFPDPKGTAGPSGLTPRQEAGFSDNDLNGDREVTRDEMLVGATLGIVMVVETSVATAETFRFDLDKNKTITLEELGKAWAGTDSQMKAAAIAAKYQAWQHSLDTKDGLTHNELEQGLGRLGRESPLAFELLILLANKPMPSMASN